MQVFFSLNPCFVCNEETSFDDMVCEEDSCIPIQFKKVNEVFEKLNLCFWMKMMALIAVRDVILN